MRAASRLKHVVTALALGWASTAMGQQVDQETPRGEIRTASVGEVVWEQARFAGARGVIIQEAVRENWGSAESVDLPAGSTLMIIRERRLKACRTRVVTGLGGYSFGGWEDCLIDTDDDGRFDRVSFNEVAGARNIVPPVAYNRATVPVEGVGSASFRRTLTFLGRSGSDIRLSYREFANDIARPAFTEELTLPLPTTFPETMTVRGLRLTVLGLDGNGLRYRLD